MKLAPQKIQDLKLACVGLCRKTRFSIRELAQVIGKLVVSFPGVLWGPLYYRQLEKVKSDALKKNKGDFDALTVLSKEA